MKPTVIFCCDSVIFYVAVYGRPVVSKPLDSQSDDVDDQSGGGKVVGGKEVKKGSHPWQVDLNFVNIISTQSPGLSL